jgi:hypothetical protein
MVSLFLGCCAWILLFLSVWKTSKMIQENLNYLRRLHQIPCSSCKFFTGDYRLKCTIHPGKALSEEALNCQDFEAKNAYISRP